MQLSEDEHIALRMEAGGADAAQLSRRRQLIRVRRRIANQVLIDRAEQDGAARRRRRSGCELDRAESIDRSIVGLRRRLVGGLSTPPVVVARLSQRMLSLFAFSPPHFHSRFYS